MIGLTGLTQGLAGWLRLGLERAEDPGHVGRHSGVDGRQGRGAAGTVGAVRDDADLVSGIVGAVLCDWGVDDERHHERAAAVALAGVLALVPARAQLPWLQGLQLRGLQLAALGVAHAVDVGELQHGAARGVPCNREAQSV